MPLPDPNSLAASDTSAPDFDTPAEMLELAQALVRIPSVSGEEAAVADFAADWLEAAGFAVERIEGAPGRPNLVASVGTGEGPLYALNGHLDTVPVPEGEAWAHDPFGAEVSEGRLYGRGSIDMKGPDAAMMWAAARVAEQAEGLQGTLQVHLVVDEEKGGGLGSAVLAEAMEAGRLPKPDGIMSGELSWLHVRLAERGFYRFGIRFEGTSSHTARARVDGLNAIAAASRGVLALEHHIDRFHPEVGYPVISLNLIEGGSSTNAVPSSCTVQVDRRTVPGETKESVLEEIRGALDTLDDVLPDGRVIPVRYQIVDEGDEVKYSEANRTPPDEPLVLTLWTNAEGVLGYRPDAYTDWGGATDARWFRKIGIPTVIFGPTGHGAHSADEYVDVSSLGVLGEVFRRTLLDLLTD
jgi:acetylornithine deacetylase/succinyl-diaminopimelate desuccinylase family protein